jgi:hypothetical protein
MNLEFIFEKLGIDKPPCPIIWTSENLNFWELGCFIQTSSQEWIEMRSTNHLKWLGYEQDTVLMHELIHALRKDFRDSYWEELLAYQVSKRAYQRFLGPLLASKVNQIACLVSLICVNLGVIDALFYVLALVLLLPCLIIALKYKHKLKNIKFNLLEKGYSHDELFKKMIRLNPEELEILAKQSRASVRNF